MNNGGLRARCAQLLLAEWENAPPDQRSNRWGLLEEVALCSDEDRARNRLRSHFYAHGRENLGGLEEHLIGAYSPWEKLEEAMRVAGPAAYAQYDTGIGYWLSWDEANQPRSEAISDADARVKGLDKRGDRQRVNPA